MSRQLFKGKIKISIVVFCLIFTFVSVGLAFSVNTAEAANSSTSNTSGNTTGNTTVYSANLDNPIDYDTGADLIGGLVKAFLGVIGALAILVIVYGGVLYIVSAGNEESLKKAKGAVTGAVIGLAVALLAYVIVDFVIKSLGGGS